MELFIHICGFTGGWLLVAGPVYQAALELNEERIETEHVDRMRKRVPPSRISAWWWLIPPVKLYLERRRSQRYRRLFVASLTPEELTVMVNFINKASGWLLVAFGGLLLATKETYELITVLEWSTVWFWVIAICMAFICFLNTVARMRGTKRILAATGTTDAEKR